MGVITYKCLTCGANLRYSPKRKKWHCMYCCNDYSIEELNKEYGTRELDEKKKEKYSCYKCENCGAELITGINTVATFCSYCNSSTIIKGRLNEEYRPKKIIPFKVTKKQAIDTYMNLKRKCWFAPDEFGNSANISMIKGVYIPCYLFDCDVISNITAKGQKIYSAKKSKLILQAKVLESDFYALKRKAIVRFKNIPIDGSVRFPNSIMKAIEPFKYSEMVDFSPKYMSGFFGERFDVISKAISNEIENRAIMTVKKDLSGIVLRNDRKYALEANGPIYYRYWIIDDDTQNHVTTFSYNIFLKHKK